MIIALAGRRVDAGDAQVVRFPLSEIEAVKAKLKDLFLSLRPEALVSSAACGADLLGLAVAGELNIPRAIVLPFDASVFKTTSVTDRPGDWGLLYETILDEVANEEGIKVLDYSPDDGETYRNANFAILDVAETLGSRYTTTDFVAVIVWEGTPKNSDDTTEHFRKAAETRDFLIKEVLSI